MLGLYVDEALGRVAAIIAALTLNAAPDNADIEWAALPAHSLKGLTAQAGDLELAEEVHDIESALDELARVSDDASRADRATAIVTRLRTIERTLGQRVAPADRSVPVAQLAASFATEIERVATRRNVAVGVDVITPPDDVQLPRRLAGVLADALGHIARNAVTHGTPAGGTVRIAFTVQADVLTVVVTDHGSGTRTAPPSAPTLEVGRGLGLQAAQGRLMAIGGDLVRSSGAWGGTSVTLRVPMP